MASLEGRSVASSYKDLLQVSNSNSGIDGTARIVSDGEGTNSNLYLSTTQVGIGGQPTEVLDVTGNAKISGGIGVGVSPSSSYVLYGSGSGSPTIRLTDTTNSTILDLRADDTGVLIRSTGNHPLRLNTNQTDRVTITNGGDVQLQERLTFSGTNNSIIASSITPHSNGFIYITGGSSGIVIGDDTPSSKIQVMNDAEIRFEVNGSEKMRLDSTGLGIGTANPDTNIHIHKGSAGSVDSHSNAVLTLENNGSVALQFLSPNSDNNIIFFGDVNDNDNGYIAYQHGSTPNLGFIVDGSEVLNLNNSKLATFSGNALISSNNNPELAINNTAQHHYKIISADNGGTAQLHFKNETLSAYPLVLSHDASAGSRVGIGTHQAHAYDAGADNLVVFDSGNAGITIAGGTSGQSNIHFGDGTGANSYRGVIMYRHGSNDDMRFYTAGSHRLTFSSSGDILPAVDDAQDLGSSSLRFDDIFAQSGTVNSSDERLKDNIADSSLGLEFINALRPVEYKFKDYTYDIEKEKAVEAEEAVYETVVIQEAVEAKEAVMGTRQKTVSKEVEKTKTEIVEEDGNYVQKEISYTETIEEPQYEEVNLYDEDGNKIQRLVSEAIEAVEGVEFQEATYYTEDDELPEGKEVGDIKTEEIQAVEAVEAKDAVYEDVLHKIPVMEEYEVEPAVEAVEEITEERLVSEAIEAKDAVMETKEKTFVRTHFGLIAQEVEQVLKDSSLTNNDFAGLIYDEDADRYGIRYHELISPLIKAVQELSKKVTDLENK